MLTSYSSARSGNGDDCDDRNHSNRSRSRSQSNHQHKRPPNMRGYRDVSPRQHDSESTKRPRRGEDDFVLPEIGWVSVFVMA